MTKSLLLPFHKNKVLIPSFIFVLLSLFLLFSNKAFASPNSTTNKISISPNSLDFTISSRADPDSEPVIFSPITGSYDSFYNYSIDPTGSSYFNGPLNTQYGNLQTQYGHSKDLTVTNNSPVDVFWELSTNSRWCVASIINSTYDSTRTNTPAGGTTQIVVTAVPNSDAAYNYFSNGNNTGPWPWFSFLTIPNTVPSWAHIDCQVKVTNAYDSSEYDWVPISYQSLIYPYDYLDHLLDLLYDETGSTVCKTITMSSPGVQAPPTDQWRCTYYGEVVNNGFNLVGPYLQDVGGFSVPSWSYSGATWQNQGTVNGVNINGPSGQDPMRIERCAVAKINPPGTSQPEYCAALCWGQLTNASTQIKKDQSPSEAYLFTPGNNMPISSCGGPTCEAIPITPSDCQKDVNGNNTGYVIQHDTCGNTYSPVLDTNTCPLPPKPDLRVDNDFSIGGAVAGSPTSFTATIRNVGTVETGVSFPNLFRTSPVYDGTSGVLSYLVSPNMSALGPSGTGLATKSHTFPVGSPSTMYISFCADKSSAEDVNGVVDEGANENNNCGNWRQINITTTPLPNLTASNDSPLAATQLFTEDGVSFAGKINNVGADYPAPGKTKAQLQIDINGDGATIGEPVYDLEITRVTAGSNRTVSWPGTAIQIGTHKYRICADVYDVLPEVDDSNTSNCSGWQTFTVIHKVQVNISAGNNNLQYPNSGTNINWSYTYANPSSCTLSPSSIGSISVYPTGSGSGSTGPLAVGTYLYRITCGLPAGTFAQATVTVQNPYNITVAKVGQGTIVGTDGLITCGGDCSEDYPAGATITLTATPSSGRIFLKWDNCNSPSGTPQQGICNEVVNSTKVITATFVLDPTFREF